MSGTKPMSGRLSKLLSNYTSDIKRCAIKDEETVISIIAEHLDDINSKLSKRRR